MKKNNSRLKIIPYHLEKSFIESIRYSSYDILALSLPAMEQLESENIKYLSLGDFISQKNFDTHLSKLAQSLPDWLIRCDSLSKNQLSLERLFSSNGFWFLHRLSHLSFLQILIDDIEDKYNHIELYVRKENYLKKTSPIDFNTLNFPLDNLFGLDGIVESLLIGLKTKIVHKFDATNPGMNIIPVNEPITNLLKRIPEITFRKSSQQFRNLVSFLIPRRKIFWSTYISYDVERLRDKKNNWNFIPIIEGQALIANECLPEDVTKLRERIYPLSNDFIMNWIPRFSSIFLTVVDEYVENILSRIPNVRSSIIKKIKKSRPQAMFFSTGVQNILHENIAEIAYKSKIPVYSFKHTGIEHLFFKSQYLDSYYDYNLDIKRTQFLVNESELEVFNNSSNVKAVVSGNWKPRLINKKNNVRRSNKILYSVGQPDHSSFHFYHCLLNDFERHTWTKNLFQSTNNNNLTLDIKIHPVEWSIYRSYFDKLLLQEKYNKIRFKIIVGGSVERILKNYDLLILDMVPTQVLSAALSMGMNIILFKQPDHFINKKTYSDLENRVHIVSDFSELDHKLEKFSKGDLEDKNNIEFDKNYLSSNLEVFEILNKANF